MNWLKGLVLIGCVIVPADSMTRGQEPSSAPTSPPKSSESQVRVDALNIDYVKPLDARGTYVHLVGSSLFVTPGRILGRIKEVPPEMKGGWFDIADDPASPRLVADSLPSAWDVVVVDGHAITCNYEKNLIVYEVREDGWREVSRLRMPSMTENIVVRGKLAYVANHEAGLTIVDISQPARPAILSNLDANIDCDALALRDEFAILYVHHKGQVVVADVGDPEKLREVGRCQLPQILNGGELELEGGFAYITSRKGLFVVDVRQSSNPVLVQTIDTNSVANDVILQDGYAFIAADRRGVRVVDIRDPLKPVEVGHYRPGGDSAAAALAVKEAPNAPGRDYYIYVADMTGPAAVLLFHAPSR